jgi:hypothetical protein
MRSAAGDRSSTDHLMTINLVCSVRNAQERREISMIALVLLAAWVLAVVAVVGLCSAARAGDLAQRAAPSAASGSAEGVPWEQLAHVEITARAGTRPARPAGSVPA